MPVTTGIYFSLSESALPVKVPVLLLHGAGGNHLCWPIELRRLAGQRILSIDLPGHGRSPGVAEHTIEAYSRVLRDFLASLGINRAVVVGHGMGGAIAQWLALEHPTLVAGLGLISCGAHLGAPEGLLEGMSNPLTYQESLERLQKLMAGPQTTPDQSDACMKMLREIRPGVLYGDWSANQDFDIRQIVNKIDCPTWIAAGAEDRLVPLPYVNYVASRIRGATLQVISGAGHLLLLEQPKALQEGLANLLDAVDRLIARPSNRQRRPRHTSNGPEAL